MKELQEKLVSSDFVGKNVLILTGAGCSVESGIPAYWGENGSYQKLQEKYGRKIELVLSKENLASNPKEVWGYLVDIFQSSRDAKPNFAHEQIAKLEGVSNSFVLATQNCDELHSLAGSKSIIEVHGTAHSSTCIVCGNVQYDHFSQLRHIRTHVPECHKCEGIMRPDVVLFNEMPKIENDQIRDFAETADVLLVIGTQAHFSYICEPMNIMAENDARLIWIDIEKPCFLDNYFITHAVSSKLEWWDKGAVSFFKDMMPGLS
jgi:NAD-dependent deacetylase